MYTFVFTHLRVNAIAATLKRCCVSEGCCNEDHRGREPDKAPPPPAFWPLILPCGVLMSAQLQRHCSGHCLKVHVWKHVYTQRCVTSNKSELVLCCSFSQEAGVSVLIHLQCVWVCVRHNHNLVPMVMVIKPMSMYRGNKINFYCNLLQIPL